MKLTKEQLDDITNNAVIVKRLKKRIEYLDGWKGIVTDSHNLELHILQKILGEENG